MTELVYYKDGYREWLDAEITGIVGNAIILDRTIFYTECGGQPGDRGSIDEVQILDTQKSDEGEVLHIVEDPSSFKVGDVVVLALDWEHRYKYMKEHSAQHLISALFFHEKKMGTVSVHQGEKVLTIELDVPDIQNSDLLDIENKANEKVREGLKIYQKEMSHREAEALNMRRSIKVDGDVKVVFIEGLDAVACGGVHVSSTAEIGEIVYLGKESIRSHIRTIWAVGDESVRIRRENSSIIQESSRLLSAESGNIPVEIKRLQNEVYQLKKERDRAYEKMAEREYHEASLTEKGKSIIFSTDLPLEYFQNIAEKEGRSTFILSENEKREFLYYGDRNTFSLLKALGLRGGGRDILFRGVCQSDGDVLERVRQIIGK